MHMNKFHDWVFLWVGIAVIRYLCIGASLVQLLALSVSYIILWVLYWKYGK